MAETVRIELPIQVLDKTNAALSNITNRLNRMEAASRKVQTSLSGMSLPVSRFDRQLQKAQRGLGNWMSEQYQILLEARDQVSPVVEKLRGRLKELSNQNWEITIKAVDNIYESLRGAGGESKKMGGAAKSSAAKSAGRGGAADASKPKTGEGSGGMNVISILNDTAGLIDNSAKIFEFGKSLFGKTSAGDAAGGAGRGAVLGTAAVAGGVVGAQVLLDGFSDLKKASESDNRQEAIAYSQSGTMKATGVVGGAAIGTMILPGIGTLIGAGIGGLMGAFGGDAITESYEEQAKAQKLAAEQAKYSSQELKDALEDTTMTAEEFEKKFQEAVGKNIQDHFGKIKLSLEEISDLAQEIVFEDSVESVIRFHNATAQAESALANFKNSSDKLDKINWKIEISPEVSLTESETQGYAAALAEYVEQAKSYIENKHYQVTMALDLLFEPGSSPEMYKTANKAYGKSRKKINGLAKELDTKVQEATKGDGVIEPKEYEGIYQTQQALGGEMDKVQAAEEAASVEALKVKYAGGEEKIGSESFSQLQGELRQQMEVSTETNFGGLKSGLEMLELARANGMHADAYENQREKLIGRYNTKNEKAKSNVLTYQFDTIAESYGEELEGILPNLGGTTAEKFNQVMKDAIENGVDPGTWDADEAAKNLSLENLNREDWKSIGGLVAQATATLPPELFQDTGELSEALPEAGKGVGNHVISGISEDLSSNADGVQPGCQAVRSAADEYLVSEFANPFNVSANVNITAKYNLLNKPPFAPQPLGPSLLPGGFASGGIVSGKQLSWVGEEGPEAIIPLVPSRRSRALELYEKAGGMLGLGQYAEGGIAGGGAQPFGSAFSGGTEAPYSTGAGDNQEQKPQIQVQVQLAPNFEIAGTQGKEEHVMDVIRRHMAEMADELGGQIASNLESVFSNMPAAEGV